jgi:hypothetical protein
MFKKISDWWNRDAIRLEAKMKDFEERYRAETARLHQQQQEERLAREQAERQYVDELRARHAVEEKLKEVEDTVIIFRRQEEEDEAKRNGTEPWVEIKSDSLDPIKGIHIELDWNEAFIQYLKDNGLKGRDDETIVQKWLAFLYEDLISRLEQQAIDNSDKPRVNDFE